MLLKNQDYQDYYLSLPHDMSGSMSKNRFRLELLWGICKMLDTYDSGDFTMVFDYACDIELHVKDGFEFYQIKTHSGRKPYTCARLTNVVGEGSILGKLYVLNKSQPGIQIKLAIVSNSPLTWSSKTPDELEFCFNNLPQTEKDKVKTALKNELNIDNVDLDRVYFIHTDMNLADPRNEVMGKLTFRFQEIKNCEPTHPNALYRLIYETVVDRACYEYSSEEYEDIVKHKGLTKAEFDVMLDAHALNARTGIQQTNDYIDQLDNLRDKRIYKQVLPKILKAMCTSRYLQDLEQKVGAFLLEHNDELNSIETGIDLLTKSFHKDFPIEIDDHQKILFYIVIIHRFIEGVYDECD